MIFGRLNNSLMLAHIRSGAGSILSRFFASSLKDLELKCDDLFRKVIDPALAKENIVCAFHGIEDGDTAVITLDGDAIDCLGGLRDKYLPDQILGALNTCVPEVTRIRVKMQLE